MTQHYRLEDLQEMNLSEVYDAVTQGMVSEKVFAKFVNKCIAVGVSIGEKKENDYITSCGVINGFLS